MEKLEDENVSLDFTVQSLIKERDNVKLEYQKLFNSIKKTRSQTQTEMDELIAHVSEKTYAYGAIRAENQNLLLDLPEELDGVHETFYVLNLKKCLADPTLQVPLDEIQVDAKLNFMEEPVEILKKEFKKLKRSRIAIVKVRWNSKRGPEFTWEREDQMKLKYPHLFRDVSS
ncbi:hypothetical protein Tco_0283219 [Tanacetum coccineum]